MEIYNIKKSIHNICLLLLLIFSPQYIQASTSIDNIINEIRVLENERDPKCYATASRLEDFMFGTPLSHEARFKKNRMQTKWVQKIWQNASSDASAKNKHLITGNDMLLELNKSLSSSKGSNNHWEVHFPNHESVRINKRDKRQYSSIAYSLRAVLSVQQQSLFDAESHLVPLGDKALKNLTEHLDLLNLTVLKLADLSARKKNQTKISRNLISSIWNAMIINEPESTKTTFGSDKNNPNKLIDLSLTRKIIEQKISSYKSYNDLSNRLFYRNLQVYYAKVNLPKSLNKQKSFRKIFNESMIQFAFDLYKESENIALKNGNASILESDVFELIQLFIPHEIDQFEDAHFFPALPPQQQIVIESYDADSFRDNSAHWRFLKHALASNNLKARLQADPFALELIAENIALFGVLSLKMSGKQAIESSDQYLKAAHYTLGLKTIARKTYKNKNAKKNTVAKEENIISSNNKTTNNNSGLDFTDITDQLEINALHDSSDWLNRLIRGFLEKKKGVGVIFIPPAFGGSGIAAEDINGDGYTDLLILSGKGNKLFMNNKGESFIDVTKRSGISWNRASDNRPGEPRQPLIADLNNDGLQDIIITYANDTHRVYKNTGDFVFTDVTEISNLGGNGLVGGPATVADFDNDGLLDIYITYFGNYLKGVLPTLKRINDNGLPNQLFKNMGNFKFKNITSNSGVDNTGWGQAVSHTDLNGDSWQDIIVGNDFGSNAYYVNNKDGTFTDIATKLGTDKASYSMNVGITDLNQDLQPDIYISNIVVMNKDEKYVSPNEDTIMKFDSDKLANMRVIEANDLFLSNSVDDKLVKYSLSSSVSRGYDSTGWSWDADFFDYDNDGDMDLYVLNGMNEFNLYTSDNPYFTDTSNKKRNVYIPVAKKEHNIFLVNQDGKLNDASTTSGLNFLANSRSAAYLDYDLDGDLDIAINNFHEKAMFFENNLDNKNSRWLKIKLIGDITKQVNRDAIGARIIINTESGKTIWREVSGSTGYMSVHPKIQHFGLGQYKIKNIQIIWPNGERQKIMPLEENKSYLIHQSEKPVLFLTK